MAGTIHAPVHKAATEKNMTASYTNLNPRGVPSNYPGNIPSMEPSQFTSTHTGFGDSIRDPGGSSRDITNVYPGEISIDNTTKGLYQVPIINTPNSPNKTSTKDSSNVPK